MVLFAWHNEFGFRRLRTFKISWLNKLKILDSIWPTEEICLVCHISSNQKDLSTHLLSNSRAQSLREGPHSIKRLIRFICERTKVSKFKT